MSSVARSKPCRVFQGPLGQQPPQQTRQQRGESRCDLRRERWYLGAKRLQSISRTNPQWTRSSSSTKYSSSRQQRVTGKGRAVLIAKDLWLLSKLGVSACNQTLGANSIDTPLGHSIKTQACALCAVLGALGQQRHPLTDIPPEAPGVEHKEWFPEHYALEFPAGDQVCICMVLPAYSPSGVLTEY